MIRPLKIFVVDDEESIRESQQWFLEELGHQVVAVAHPGLLCDVWKPHDCKQEHPCTDALIIDKYMPVMTGLDYIDKLTERGCKGLHINIAIMSAAFTDRDLQRAEQLGSHVLSKPFAFECLKTWLEQVQQYPPSE